MGLWQVQPKLRPFAAKPAKAEGDGGRDPQRLCEDAMKHLPRYADTPDGSGHRQIPRTVGLAAQQSSGLLQDAARISRCFVGGHGRIPKKPKQSFLRCLCRLLSVIVTAPSSKRAACLCPVKVAMAANKSSILSHWPLE